MKPQTPAEGILLHRDYGESKLYQIPCDCQDPSHEHKIWVEAADIGVTVTTYTYQKTNRWQEISKTRNDIDNEFLQECEWFLKGLINGLWRRIRLTWTLWAKGYVEYEATLIMSEQQAINYAEVLKSAAIDVKEAREKYLKEWKAKNGN